MCFTAKHVSLGKLCFTVIFQVNLFENEMEINSRGRPNINPVGKPFTIGM